jgi:hypothetical protein
VTHETQQKHFLFSGLRVNGKNFEIASREGESFLSFVIFASLFFLRTLDFSMNFEITRKWVSYYFRTSFFIVWKYYLCSSSLLFFFRNTLDFGIDFKSWIGWWASWFFLFILVSFFYLRVLLILFLFFRNTSRVSVWALKITKRWVS